MPDKQEFKSAKSVSFTDTTLRAVRELSSEEYGGVFSKAVDALCCEALEARAQCAHGGD